MRDERRVGNTLRGLWPFGRASGRALAMAALLVARAAVAQYELAPSALGAGGGSVTGGPFVLFVMF